jgi:tetratricopeptide (TPR) repeat protein
MPDTPERALTLAEQGKFAETIAILQSLAQANPTQWQLWHDLAVCHLAQANFLPAMQAIEQALGQAADDPVLHTSYAVAMRVAGNLEPALEKLQQVTAATPGHVDAWRNYAALLLAAGKPKEAAKAVAQLKQLSGDAVPDYQRAVLRTLHAAESGKPFEFFIRSDGSVEVPHTAISVRNLMKKFEVDPKLAPLVEQLAGRLDETREAIVGDIRLRRKPEGFVLEKFSPTAIEASIPVSDLSAIEYVPGAPSPAKKFLGLLAGLLLVGSVIGRIHSWLLAGILFGGFLLLLPFVATGRSRRGLRLTYRSSVRSFLLSTYVFESNEHTERIHLETFALTIILRALLMQ